MTSRGTLLLGLLLTQPVWAQFQMIDTKTADCWAATGDIYAHCIEEKKPVDTSDPLAYRCDQMKEFTPDQANLTVQQTEGFQYLLPAIVKINEGKFNEMSVKIDEDGYITTTSFYYRSGMGPSPIPNEAPKKKGHKDTNAANQLIFKDLYRYTFNVENGPVNPDTWTAPTYKLKIVGYKLEENYENKFNPILKLHIQLSNGVVAVLDGQNIVGTYHGALGSFNPKYPGFNLPSIYELDGRESLNYRNKHDKWNCTKNALIVRTYEYLQSN